MMTLNVYAKNIPANASVFRVIYSDRIKETGGIIIQPVYQNALASCYIWWITSIKKGRAVVSITNISARMNNGIISAVVSVR